VKTSLLLACAAVLAASCTADGDPSPGAEGSAAVFRTTAAIEEVMRYMIDPAADSIWNAVVTEVTSAGTTERAPSSDEEWAALRGHAITLIESTNLLLMEGRHVAAPGSRSDMPGVDLEPEQIEALLSADRDAWAAFVGGLQATGVNVLAAIDAKDVEGLLVTGDELDLACENCHVRYWYPSLATDNAR
jgi:hypothetical protein